MLVNKGDKIVLKEKMGLFDNIGEICEVTSVDGGIISFTFGEGLHLGCMSEDEADKYFVKYVEEPKIYSVSSEDIDDILENCEIEMCSIFDKCMIVACKLPNGFVVVESSACVDPNNYDEDVAFDNCIEKITNKIWELEGYVLQEDLYRGKAYNETFGNECLHECDNCCKDENEDYDDKYDEEDIFGYEDVDCNNCDDYSCPHNQSR